MCKNSGQMKQQQMTEMLMILQKMTIKTMQEIASLPPLGRAVPCRRQDQHNRQAVLMKQV